MDDSDTSFFADVSLEQVAAVTSAAELAAVVLRMHRDLRARGDDWENATLERYLEALAAVVGDLDIHQPLSWAAGIMGWSKTDMRLRCQHLTGTIRGDIAERVGALLWTSDAPVVNGSRHSTTGALPHE